jgi:N-acyl-D-amino-acid deacylase
MHATGSSLLGVTKHLTIVLSLLMFASGEVAANDSSAIREEIRGAVEAGLRTLEKSMATYPDERTCFSCHHQTLPMQALVIARRHGFAINETLFREQAELTHKFFKARTNTLKEGGAIGGKSMTVGFGLWALDLSQWKSDDITSAMVDYLLKAQGEDGGFWSSSTRPPLEDSAFTGTAVATYYMKKYVSAARSDTVERAAAAGQQWLLKTNPKTQEDFNSKLWGLHLLGAEKKQIEQARAAVLKSQRSDGGWAQLDEMDSDSYATGQTLFVLRETGTPSSDPAYEKGLRQLLTTRRADGTWFVKTRSKPIQTYFESGFPHGKDQFISICGTSWAVAALAAAY